ncbi:MAG: hypothetical protein QOF51_4004 [Chloroflexota bacterium]|jgi:hypothetical protein|nr:hypothetical protein [Chloroflexota bacterium]
MANPGHFSDVLRLLGHFLDEQRAQAIEIVDHGAYFSVSWMTAGPGREERTYRAFELRQLLIDAKRHRGEASDARRLALTYTDILRAIGDECDQESWELLSVAETDEGFRMTASDQGRHVALTYERNEVALMIDEQRARRIQTGLAVNPLRR